MSRSKKNYREFPINNVKEALVVLGQLIMCIICDLEKYKRYNLELKDTINDYVEFNQNTHEIIKTEPIPEEIFNNLNDKILFRQMNMLMMISDEQKNSFSYKHLRKELKKKQFIKSNLPESINAILNDFLDIRNLTFHNTKSRLSATYEVAEKSIPKELKSLVSIVPQLNPVVTSIYEFYDATYLLSLNFHMVQRIDQINLILDYMKKDYTEMYKALNPMGFVMFNGKLFRKDQVHFEIHKIKQPKKIFDPIDMATQISMAIQKNKYDGSDKDFNKWTCKTPPHDKDNIE